VRRAASFSFRCSSTGKRTVIRRLFILSDILAKNVRHQLTSAQNDVRMVVVVPAELVTVDCTY
jgi:hypothetical protein